MTKKEHAKVLAALETAIRQNSHDMLMTGEEIRLCESAAAIMRKEPEPPTVKESLTVPVYEVAE